MDRGRVLRSRLRLHPGGAQNDVVAHAAASGGDARGHARRVPDFQYCRPAAARQSNAQWRTHRGACHCDSGAGADATLRTRHAARGAGSSRERDYSRLTGGHVQWACRSAGPFLFRRCATFSRNRPQKCHRWRASGGIDPVHRLQELGNCRGRVVRGYAPVVVSQQNLPRLKVHPGRSQSTAERMLQVVYPNAPETLRHLSTELFWVDFRGAFPRALPTELSPEPGLRVVLRDLSEASVNEVTLYSYPPVAYSHSCSSSRLRHSRNKSQRCYRMTRTRNCRAR